MKSKIISIIAIIAITLIAYGVDEAIYGSNELNAALNPEEVKEMVHNYTVGDVKAEAASITSTELIVTDEEDNKEVYDLPENDFFVSIAPFIHETHPCDVHSLTGCQGELTEEDFDVYIEDSNGDVVLDETRQSKKNGFIDLWLPREETFTVTITQDDKTTHSEISTFEDDHTCITTLQLS